MSALKASSPVAAKYDYARFSQLSGNFDSITGRTDYTVTFRKLMTAKQTKRTRMLVAFSFIAELVFILWLLAPSHYPATNSALYEIIGSAILVAAIALIELFRLTSVISLGSSILNAREPVPMRPQRGTRVAFLTTIVPSKEPIELVRKTLEAMMRVRHNGVYDVWLLDEGNDSHVKAVCAELGVNHFSRNGIEKWNQPTGKYRAKTKHGNLNAWLDMHGETYEFGMCVDSDHVPHQNFAERMLGYFRDPNVAFVVGPQVYGNVNNFITKAAESQASIFQSTIQRGANRFTTGMFVGTNNAFRIRTWRQIGGFQDSITEDLLTSLKVHASFNPSTGVRWKSVYTPDVVAVGEGPSSWADFFSQQLRWSRGAGEVVRHHYWRYFWKLSPAQRVHYSLILACFPAAGMSWLLGALIGALYLIGGYAGPNVPQDVWGALYVDVAASQYALYVWMNKYNVSPHEDPSSAGTRGILISILSMPMYAAAWIDTLLSRKTSFVITPKGENASSESLVSFKRHLQWGVVYASIIGLGAATNHHFLMTNLWAGLSLFGCLLPLLIWRTTRIVKPHKIVPYQPSINFKEVSS